MKPESRRPPFARVLALPLLALVLASCASNPTGGTDFVLMSERSELEKGKELHEAMLKENAVYTEPMLQDYVNSVGQKMAKVSHRPDLEYTFTILDSPDINAFALPGGHIYINRGLLAYLNSEDQLAAVLGHEIGHVTARHAVRQQTAARSTNALSTAANIAVFVASGGLATLGGTGDLIGGALLSGYGRDMELDADALGAEYLAKAGYDPQAMVEVITVLKNQEDFNKKVANKAPSYHGLFSTHPRNDTRLREQVGLAEQFTTERAEIDPAVFRQRLSGLPLGRAMQTAGQQDRNRYYQNLLGYTMVFPDGWQKAETTTTVTATGEGGTIRVEAKQLQEMKDPRLYLSEDLGIRNLQKAERLSQFGLPGYTGIDPSSGARVALLYYGPRAFLITGTPAGNAEGADELFLNTIRSFRAIDRNELALANPIKIEYVQVNGRTTYAELAQYMRINQYPVEMLRLLNGDYPSGEPQPGEWIKLAR